MAVCWTLWESITYEGMSLATVKFVLIVKKVWTRSVYKLLPVVCWVYQWELIISANRVFIIYGWIISGTKSYVFVFVFPNTRQIPRTVVVSFTQKPFRESHGKPTTYWHWEWSPPGSVTFSVVLLCPQTGDEIAIHLCGHLSHVKVKAFADVKAKAAPSPHLT